jgi:hypothetical protein
MGQTQHRATEVAKTLSRFIKADLAEGLSLALIHRKFPGVTRDEILQVMLRFLGCLTSGARNLRNSAA